MKIERTEVVWLESRSDYTARDLAELSGLPVELLNELIDCGALPVVRETAREHDRAHMRFEKECIALVRAARRLRDDFELDANGLAVALSLQRRMRALEAELAEARARRQEIVEVPETDRR